MVVVTAPGQAVAVDTESGVERLAEAELEALFAGATPDAPGK